MHILENGEVLLPCKSPFGHGLHLKKETGGKGKGHSWSWFLQSSTLESPRASFLPAGSMSLVCGTEVIFTMWHKMLHTHTHIYESTSTQVPPYYFHLLPCFFSFSSFLRMVFTAQCSSNTRIQSKENLLLNHCFSPVFSNHQHCQPSI